MDGDRDCPLGALFYQTPIKFEYSCFQLEIIQCFPILFKKECFVYHKLYGVITMTKLHLIYIISNYSGSSTCLLFVYLSSDLGYSNTYLGCEIWNKNHPPLPVFFMLKQCQIFRHILNKQTSSFVEIHDERSPGTNFR